MTDFEDSKKPNEDANVGNEDENYDTGYCKPPKHTQFKKGQSGNPKGRPKGSRNFSTDLKDTLKQPVRLTSDGKKKTVSTQLAALWRLREQALSGNARALDRYIELARTYNDEEIAEATVKLAQTDAEILDRYNKPLLRRAAKPKPNDDNEVQTEPVQDTSLAEDNDHSPEEEDDDAWLY